MTAATCQFQLQPWRPAPDPDQTTLRQPDNLAKWLAGIGFFLLFVCGALVARLIWEMTVWSWESGPQMVGFRLLHGGGAILVFFPIFLIVWLAIALFHLALNAWKDRKVSRVGLVAMGLSVVMLGVLWLPYGLSYGLWQRLFVDRLIKGPYAGDFLVLDAAIGDLATVETFVAHGLSPDTRNRSGRTALNAAAVAGRKDVVRYLVSVGAAASTLPHMSDEQAQKAIDEMVREPREKGVSPDAGSSK